MQKKTILLTYSWVVSVVAGDVVGRAVVGRDVVGRVDGSVSVGVVVVASVVVTPVAPGVCVGIAASVLTPWSPSHHHLAVQHPTVGH